MALTTPLLWQATPFGHREATLDLLGSHDRWHTLLARRVGGIGERRLDDLASQLDTHNRLHQRLAAGLGLSDPDDLALFDLRRRDGWVLFWHLHALEHERLRIAAGV